MFFFFEMTLKSIEELLYCEIDFLITKIIIL